MFSKPYENCGSFEEYAFIRHLFDIYQIWKNDTLVQFSESDVLNFELYILLPIMNIHLNMWKNIHGSRQNCKNEIAPGEF